MKINHFTKNIFKNFNKIKEDFYFLLECILNKKNKISL